MSDDEKSQTGVDADDPRQREAEKRAQNRQEAAIDLALIERVRAGDKTAFDELYRRYHTKAYNVAFRVVKNEESAMDVVQDAFIKVYRNLDGFAGTSSFYTWMYKIVMNLAIDKVRAKKRDQKLVEFDERVAGDGGDAQASAPGHHPLRRVLRSELQDRIREALAELPEYHQLAIVLREVDGLSYEEIAELMDCPKGTVMSRLFHARRKMQERLGAYLDGTLEIDD